MSTPGRLPHPEAANTEPASAPAPDDLALVTPIAAIDAQAAVARRVMHSALEFLRELGFSEPTLRAASAACFADEAPPPSDPLVPTAAELAAVTGLVAAWYSTETCLDPGTGEPRALPRQGPVSVARLVHDARLGDAARILQAALQTGSVQQEERLFRPTRRILDMPGAGAVQLWVESTTAQRTLQTLTRNIRARRAGEPTRFQRFVHQPRLATAHVPLFRRFLRGQGDAFLCALDEWLEQHPAGPGEAATDMSVHTVAWWSETDETRPSAARREPD